MTLARRAIKGVRRMGGVRIAAVVLIGLGPAGMLLGAPGGLRPGLIEEPDEPAEAAAPKVDVQWELVNVSTTLNLQSGEGQCNIQMRGRATPLDGSSIVGVAQPIRVTLLEDDQGHDLRQPHHQAPRNQQQYRPLAQTAANQPKSIPLSVVIRNLGFVPQRLTAVAGEIDVLIAEEKRVTTIEPVVAGALRELMAGVTFEIDRVERHRGNQTAVHYTYESTRGDVFHSQQPDQPMVQGVRAIGPDGQALTSAGARRTSRKEEDGLLKGGGTYSFVNAGQDGPAKLEIEMVIRTREQVVPFVLGELVMPGQEIKAEVERDKQEVVEP